MNDNIVEEELKEEIVNNEEIVADELQEEQDTEQDTEQVNKSVPLDTFLQQKKRAKEAEKRLKELEDK